MSLGVIRRITSFDLDRVIELEKKCFNEQIAYNPKQLKYLISKANSNCLADTVQETIRGFIIVLYKNNSDIAGIETINVDPIHQGKGIGKKLIYASEQDMYIRGINKVRLEVSVGNFIAINLYERSGFRRIAFLKNYYKNEYYGTHDAYRMIKQLTT